MQRGGSARFRRASVVDRVAAAAGSLLPRRLRPLLGRAYGAALSVLRPSDLVAVLPRGERIRLHPRYRGLTWNPEEYQAFRAELRPGDTALDVGANLGAYTLLFAHHVGPAGRVVAFEPAPEPREGLGALVGINGFEGRVTVIAAAATDREGTAPFRAHGLDGANRLDSGGEAEVATTTIDATCRRLQLSPRLIKIDAEGAELQVLRGARETIRAAGAELRLYVEMHPHLWASAGASREAIETELRAQRLEARRLDGGADIWGIEGVCLRLVPCAS